MPTCTLVISNISDDGLPRYQPNTDYWGLNDIHYPDLIVDSNGNYQAIYVAGNSGNNPTPTWGTNVGDFTVVGTVTFRRVIPIEGNGYTALAYSLASVKLGASFKLTWTSSNDVISATIDGLGTVAPNGSLTVIPGVGQFYTGAFDYNQNLIFNVPGGGYANVVSVGAPYYKITVSDGTSTASAIAMFMLVSPFGITNVKCFAPVTAANGSDFGGEGVGLPPAPPNFPRWQKYTAVARGTQRLDSNGFGQIALINGITGNNEPANWAAKGLVTTELVTGLQWENTGQVYPSKLKQTGFGPLWNRPNSSVTHGFEAMVLPTCISDVIPYAVNQAVGVGDIKSITFNSAYLGNSGIIYFECFLAGVTGPTDPSTIEPYSMNMMRGELIPDASFNAGGTPVWKVMGSMTITLNLVGGVIEAPNAYTNSVTITGVIPPVFDGNISSHTLQFSTDINAFLADPASLNSRYSAGNTASVPPTNVPLTCPSWLNDIGLGTGYINTSCENGFDASVAGLWAEFLLPSDILSIPPAPPIGSLTIKKITNPPASFQAFDFVTNFSLPFSLLDGEQQTFQLAPGIYTITESLLPDWGVSSSLNPMSVIVLSGLETVIVFTNTYNLTMHGFTLVGDYNEGIGQESLKWDLWSYHTNSHLLDSPTGFEVEVCTLLPSGAIIKFNPNNLDDYIDGIITNPILQFAHFGGHEPVEGVVNLFTGVKLKATGSGSIRTTIFSEDDTTFYKALPEPLITKPGQELQIKLNFVDERGYLCFANSRDADAYFEMSRLITFGDSFADERVQ